MAEKLPSVMIERPKMPRATWDALRAHIVRERQRKKLELEQNAEVSQFLAVDKRFPIFVTICSNFSMKDKRSLNVNRKRNKRL